MPNKHAAIKDLRKNKRRAANNSRIKTNVKSLYKTGLSEVKGAKKDEAQKAIRAFQQAVDKAAKRGVISKNAASRKKSALMKMMKVEK